MAARNAPTKWTLLSDEMLLADELVEVARAHPGREWLALRRWLEERFGSSADDPAGGGHEPMVARAVAVATQVRGLERHPRDLGHDPQQQEQANQRATHDRHFSDVTRHVVIFVGSGSCERRARADNGLRGGALRATLAGLLCPALLGHDRGLELGGASLFLRGERPRAGGRGGRGIWRRGA